MQASHVPHACIPAIPVHTRMPGFLRQMYDTVASRSVSRQATRYPLYLMASSCGLLLVKYVILVQKGAYDDS